MAGVPKDAKESGDDSRSSILPELNTAFVLPMQTSNCRARFCTLFLTAMSSPNVLVRHISSNLW